MNDNQRSHYFGKLWPAVCIAHGWYSLGSTERECKRRAVTLKATGKDSTKDLTEWEITKLFNYLKLLADDTNINAAMPVANLEIARDSDERRRLIFAMLDCEFTVFYIQKVADGYCRQERVDDWRKLSTTTLRRLVITIKERARARDKKIGREVSMTPRRVTPCGREKSDPSRALALEYAARDPLSPAVAALILDRDGSENPF